MKFYYEAKTQDGVEQKGFVEAGSNEGALDILQQRKLIVISVKEAKATTFSFKSVIGRTSQKDVAVFSRQLATLFNAKVPVVESLRTLVDQESKTAFRDVINEIAHDVESGTPLSRAFARHPEVFSDFFIQVVKSGEVSGKLGDVFQYLADYLERDVAVRRKVQGALIYPAFIVTALVLVMIVLMTYVMPQLSSILQDVGQTLPLSTRIVMGVSSFVSSFWWIIVLVVAFAAVLFWRYVKTEEGKMVWDKFLLDFPIIGKLLEKVYMMRFAETLSLLLSGGLPLPQSLEISKDMMGNMIYKNVLGEMLKAVREGVQMSTILRQNRYVPKLVSQMVSVGENTGRLDEMLKHISKFFNEEVESSISNLTTTIEPLLIIIIGAAVGFIVVSVIMPIYNLAGSF